MMSGLPDPVRAAEFYDDVPAKRLIAWVLDTALIAALTALAIPFTLGIALFFLPGLWLVLNFLYRWVTLARGSATWGMRVTAIEFRTAEGHRLDGTTAFLHTLGYSVSLGVFPLQLISIGLMLTTPRAQGLTDHILGTAAINRSSAY